mgnify:CR=1 FL=1
MKPFVIADSVSKFRDGDTSKIYPAEGAAPAVAFRVGALPTIGVVFCGPVCFWPYVTDATTLVMLSGGGVVAGGSVPVMELLVLLA